ncbi:MAG: peptide-methionine (S)-S-oxide reductase [Candidatus Peregrinibacteria bacterium Greene0416_19]|nr:MAG: peptide-methionine (S)-S-oxide reductase [Candidatus Peregrinibacteria bacterium Greene0416_19]
MWYTLRVSDLEIRLEEATFSAGCFWGIEEVFRNTNGIVSTEVGYTGGITENPTYAMVCTGATGHAEAVKVSFDPSIVRYDRLLTIFFDNHNPTMVNRQGPDIGDQYRSAIFFHSLEQEKAAREFVASLEKSNRWKKSIVTQIVPAVPFFKAEDYHQQYLSKRGLDSCHV